MAFQEGYPREILTLNVGGTLMQVQRRVLTQVEGSLLAVKFSGRWDKADLDANGNIFIDFPIEVFKPLVDLLRMTTNIPSFHEPPLTADDFGGDKRLFRRFLGLVDFYGLLDVLYFSDEIIRPVRKAGEIVRSVDAIRFGKDAYISEFYFQPSVPELHVSSYQIDAVGQMNHRESRVKIGWRYDKVVTYLFESHSPGKNHHKDDDFLGNRKDNLEGKRWIVVFRDGKIRVTITRHDDSLALLERNFSPSIGNPAFIGSGVFSLSNVTFCY